MPLKRSVVHLDCSFFFFHKNENKPYLLWFSAWFPIFLQMRVYNTRNLIVVSNALPQYGALVQYTATLVYSTSSLHDSSSEYCARYSTVR